MPDPPSRLIEAAVRPLYDNAELKQSAIGFLKNRITPDADQDAMIARWAEVDARKRQSFRHTGLWVLVAVVSAGIAISDFHEISRAAKWGKLIVTGSFFGTWPEDSAEITARNLNESEKLLLFGDRTKATKAERKEALWRSEPDNPAYFADYAGGFISENEKLPPDFLQTARRIDPDNAWFTYLAAGVESKDCVKSKSRKSTKVAGRVSYEEPKSWEIRDQARLDRSMELLREARSQPKYTDYGAVMLRKRLPVLPQETVFEQWDSVACLAEFSDFSNIRLMRLAQAISAQACSLGESGDVLGFQEIAADCDQFIRRICSDEMGTLLDQMVTTAMVAILAESFSSAAEKLGLEDEAARWKSIEERILDSRERVKSREFVVDGKAVKPGTITGGIISGVTEMIAKRPETQPPLTDADLKPMRLLDHELHSWIFSHISWVLLALCAGLAASYRLRVTVMFRRLARRMEELLRPTDWGWIFAVGVTLPFVFVMVVNRLTPLGGRAFGVLGMELLMPAGHFLGLLLLWLTLPVQVVRWRLAKRAGGFGFPKPSGIGWLSVVCAAAFVPMIGWAAISRVGESWLSGFSNWPWQFWVAGNLSGFAILGVVVSIGIAMLGRADRQLYHATSALVMVKVLAVAMLVIALASVGFKASERHWFRQDRMTKFDVAGPGWSAFESKVAAQMRKELREVMGYDP